jgi:hypothetical protein
MQRGILIASDHHTEWLLPWWSKYYSLYNNYPVAIVDYGMSPAMRQWCESRWIVIDLLTSSDFISQKNDLPSDLGLQWESMYNGKVWTARAAWFKKPLACLLTPFDLTIWIDIDCEICRSLTPLFAEWESGIELALVNDERVPGVPNYNSGVILYSKEASFLKEWASFCVTQNQIYIGDQEILTEILLKGEVPFKQIDPIYNWVMFWGINYNAVIAHWATWGKEYIRKHGGLHALMGKT